MEQSLIQSIQEYFKSQPIEKAWLFGSFSRGEQTTDSDVDLLVRFDKDAHVGLFAHTRMVLALEQLLNRKVDLVPEGALLDFAKDSVDRDKQLIYTKL